MPAVIIALIIALTTAAGGGAVYASQDALPGDALYQVKTTVEGVQLTLATSDEAKAQTYLTLADKRLAEVQKASQNGNTTAVAIAAEELAQDMAQIDQHLSQAAATGKDITSIAALLTENLARQQKVLATVEERAPEQAKAALAKAAEEAEHGLTTASANMRKRPGAGAPMGLTSSPTATTTGVEPSATPTLATPTVTTAVSSSMTMTFTQIISDVQNLASDPNLPGQSHNGLVAKLQAAQAALDRGQSGVAVQILDAFLGELNALDRSGHISADNYNTLYANYSALVTSLGGTPKPEATSVPSINKHRNEMSQPSADATPEPTESPDLDGTRVGRPSPMGVPTESEGPHGQPNWHPTEVPNPTAIPVQPPAPPAIMPPVPTSLPAPYQEPAPHSQPGQGTNPGSGMNPAPHPGGRR